MRTLYSRVKKTEGVTIRFVPPSVNHETSNESSVVGIALGDCPERKWASPV